VAHGWGVGKWQVWTWRKALGVGATTEGTSRLRSDYAREPWAVQARRKAVTKAQDPERRGKIAAARRGKPRPPHVVQAVITAHRGKPLSEETRRKMSAAHKRRGTLVPGTRLWTAEEDELVWTLPRGEAARRTGRTLQAVTARRRRLGLPDGRPRG
jgi:NUMOD3 motif